MLAPRNGSLPVAGQTFRLQLSSLPNPSTAVLAIGFAMQPPIHLLSLGMPGCSLLAAPEITQLAVPGAGSANWDLPLPGSSAIVGFAFYLQGFALDRPANPFGATVSNGAAAIIG